MHDSKSSKRRRTSSGGWAAAAGTVLLAAALSASAAWWVLANGYTLYYGDAQAHLNIARRIIDSRTPGYEQFGTVWLPLPHAAMLPFVGSDEWWRSGLAGAIPAALSFVLAGGFLYGAARRALGTVWAGFAAAMLFALNPNLLYLQSTPMSEPFAYAGVLGMVYFAVVVSQTGSLWAAAAAGLMSNVASMSRYEGWFLIPFTATAILIAAPRRRWMAACLFGAVAALGPLYWLAHNYYFYGDALEFYRGPYSAKAIYQRALDAGMARYPGDHEWPKAWLYFREAATLCAGQWLLWLAAAGGLAALWRRAFVPLALLLLLPLFYVFSLYSSGTPIFVPHLWPHSYYNTRYGLAALPLLCFAAAGLVAVLPRRLVPAGAVLAIVLGAYPWVRDARPEAWITWKESQVNSDARRAWTAKAAEYLRPRVRPGDGVLTSFGDLAGIFPLAGLRLQRTLHEGNDPLWTAALARPDLFLWEEWAVAIAGDKVSTALQRANRRGPAFDRVHEIVQKGAPVIEIYRRRDANPLHEGARSAQ
ncbi:MAG: hypothetical protein SFV54_28910 [Bryobacteraceae bacterium]|nr:hypothetical protein [Bryobacteraceae bacterium]